MPALLRARRQPALPVLLAALLASLLVATSWVCAPHADAAAHSKRERKIHHATQIAKRQAGDPYVYGAEGPNAFDCSGLTYFSYRRVGIRLPRTSDGQYRRLRHIRKAHMRRGDLVFFHHGRDVYHVGIFVGWKDGRRVILHAPYPGRRVHRERIWSRHWWAATLRTRHR